MEGTRSQGAMWNELPLILCYTLRKNKYVNQIQSQKENGRIETSLNWKKPQQRQEMTPLKKGRLFILWQQKKPSKIWTPVIFCPVFLGFF